MYEMKKKMLQMVHSNFFFCSQHVRVYIEINKQRKNREELVHIVRVYARAIFVCIYILCRFFQAIHLFSMYYKLRAEMTDWTGQGW